MTSLRIYIIAGEPSGDLLGARMMKSLREKHVGPVEFFGIGGLNMEEQGLKSLFPMAELTIMGLTEVLPHIPKILGRIKQTIQDVQNCQPDALITIDAPGFTFRVAKKLKGQGFPLIHYVAPTVWAWKPKRAKKVSKFLDHLLTLLPFEPPYFEKEGLKTSFVGHSVLEGGADEGQGDEFKKKHGIPSDCPILCLLPGSRKGEVEMLLPTFKEAISQLKQKRPDLRVILPTVATVADRVKELTLSWQVPVLIVENQEEKFDAFAAADVALAASGTVSLELAMSKTPTVIAYRLKPLTYKIAKHLIKVPYASLVNILKKEEIIPEFIQHDCTSEKLTVALEELLDNKDNKATLQIEKGQEALQMLGKGDLEKPSGQAAQVVLNILSAQKESKHI